MWAPTLQLEGARRLQETPSWPGPVSVLAGRAVFGLPALFRVLTAQPAPFSTWVLGEVGFPRSALKTEKQSSCHIR